MTNFHYHSVLLEKDREAALPWNAARVGGLDRILLMRRKLHVVVNGVCDVILDGLEGAAERPWSGDGLCRLAFNWEFSGPNPPPSLGFRYSHPEAVYSGGLEQVPMPVTPLAVRFSRRRRRYLLGDGYADPHPPHRVAMGSSGTSTTSCSGKNKSDRYSSCGRSRRY